MFPPGSCLFDDHHPSRRLYLLHSGHVQLITQGGAIVDYVSRGEFFGQQCLNLATNGGLTARSLTAIEVSAFRKSQVLSRMQQDPRFAARLLDSLAGRLERYAQTIRDAVLESTERRLVLLLWRMLPAEPGHGWVRLRFNPSNPELARTIGSTRWRVASFIGSFRRLGWLDRRPELWVHCEGLKEFLESTARKP